MQWSEQSPSTNVAPEFEYRRRSHIRVLRFSPLLKNRHFQITIRYGTHGHLDLLCFMGKQITIFLILSRVKRACLDRFSSLPAPLGFLEMSCDDFYGNNLGQMPVRQFEAMSLQCCNAVLRQKSSLRIISCTGILRYFLTLINNSGLKTHHYCEERYHRPSS